MVNFTEALNLSPMERRDEYETQTASEIINSIIPMHWTGKDLIGICSNLGFQSYEYDPSFKSPMSLPMQWSGPLGWLQFRASANGCVVEFRRRMVSHHQISDSVHEYYKLQADPSYSPHNLRCRLWNSINGFALDDDERLFIGAPTRSGGHSRRMKKKKKNTDAKLFGELMSGDMSQDDMMRKLGGMREAWLKALRGEVEGNTAGMSQRKDNDIPDFVDTVLCDKMDSSSRKQVLRPCNGLLSVTVYGEPAYSRGLSVADYIEYDRKYTVAEDIDKKSYPYNLGDLYMGETLLWLMKRALLLLRPDGFYFSPAPRLFHDLCEVYQHIEDLSNTRRKIFLENVIEGIIKQAATSPSTALLATCAPGNKSTNKGNGDMRGILNAMRLCNELQETRKQKRACFSVDEMQLMAKAAAQLQRGASASEKDLIWAVLYCPAMSSDMLKQPEKGGVEAFLEMNLMVKDRVICCDSWTAETADGNE